MAIKKLWLHIGTHKTGTTTLQNFFLKNKSNLSKSNINYPTEGSYYYKGEASQSLLSHAIRNVKPDYLPSNLIFTLEQCESDLRNDITSNPCEMALLSSEHFSHSSTIEDVIKIKKCFESYVDEIKIIIYLRRQDHLLESFYNQHSKLGLTIDAFDGWVEKKLNTAEEYLFYDKKLNLFSEVFGKENIIVRIFEKGQLHPLGVIHDFMGLLGIYDLSKMAQVDHLNKSFPVEFSEIIRYSIMHYDNLDIRKSLAGLIRSVHIDGLDFARYTLFDEGLRKMVLDCFRESNRNVAKVFFQDRPDGLFYEPEVSLLPKYPGLTSEKIALVLSQIVMHQQLTMKNMQKSISFGNNFYKLGKSGSLFY